MTFKEVLAHVIDWLQQDQRISYRALKRQFALDDDYLEDLKVELIEVIINRCEIKITPLWLQHTGTLRQWPEAGECRLLPYIRPYSTQGSGISVAQICHHRPPDSLRCLQEHTVQAHAISLGCIPSRGKH